MMTTGNEVVLQSQSTMRYPPPPPLALRGRQDGVLASMAGRSGLGRRQEQDFRLLGEHHAALSDSILYCSARTGVSRLHHRARGLGACRRQALVCLVVCTFDECCV